MPREPKPFLSGNEVMKSLKIKPGKKVGTILSELKEKQLAQEIRTKKEAMQWLKNQEKPTREQTASI